MDLEGLCGGGGGFPRPQQQVQAAQRQQRPTECFSDEVNSRGGGEEEEEQPNGGGGSGGPVQPPSSGAGPGGDTGGKRRRGRPPGSKNKPKPVPVLTRDVEPAAAMRPHVLEVPSGGDVARALAAFARRRGLGICVLAGTGAVADVSLRHPSDEAGGSAAAVVVFRGRYEILSISATFLAPSMSTAVPRAAARDLSVSLAGPHGQIVGGAVVGPLVASTAVVVLAAAFTDLTFHRLPIVDNGGASASVSGNGEAEERRGRGGHQTPPPAETQGASGLHQQPYGMAPATQATVPMHARQSHEAWPTAATAQRPRPPYQ